ncbi:dr1-associated corepressor [Onthophagus taurus]|uniref:dr1-associated corepressor n=1 Tax=Onthophagus taurus TaxID=166361 RepID=UPI000C20D251|nr:dr1-associated corepressor [Onthophagus taurus]
MPSKKKKYNARFPASRIKKIMQTDEEVGKVAQAVPVIISRTLELFVESLLKKSMQITQARNAKTLTQSHMKQCILSESRFDFLKDLVKDIPDASVQDDNESNVQDMEITPRTYGTRHGEGNNDQETSTPRPEIAANFYTEQGTSRTPVIQYGPNVMEKNSSKTYTNKSHTNTNNEDDDDGTVIKSDSSSENVPSLIPISHNMYGQSTGDNLYIDEDYDN